MSDNSSKIFVVGSLIDVATVSETGDISALIGTLNNTYNITGNTFNVVSIDKAPLIPNYRRSMITLNNTLSYAVKREYFGNNQ